MDLDHGLLRKLQVEGVVVDRRDHFVAEGMAIVDCTLDRFLVLHTAGSDFVLVVVAVNRTDILLPPPAAVIAAGALIAPYRPLRNWVNRVAGLDFRTDHVHSHDKTRPLLGLAKAFVLNGTPTAVRHSDLSSLSLAQQPTIPV